MAESVGARPTMTALTNPVGADQSLRTLPRILGTTIGAWMLQNSMSL